MKKHIGIVKWFGGMYGEKNYGFICPCNGGEDVFIHRNELKNKNAELDVGSFVLYKIGKRKGKICATNLDLLINHKTVENYAIVHDLIHNCDFMYDTELRDEIVIQYLLHWTTLNEAENYILDQEKENRYLAQNLIKQLPCEFVLQSKKIREILPYQEQFEMLLNVSIEKSNKYLEYFLNILKYNLVYVSIQVDKTVYYKIYDRFHCKDERLYRFVNPLYLDILIEKWRESQYSKDLEDSIIFFCKSPDRLYRLLSNEEFIKSDKIRGILNPRERILVLCDVPLDCSNEYYEEFIITLELATNNTDIFTLDLLTKIFHRFHCDEERFYKIIPADYLKVLLEQYRNNREDYLNQIISFIKIKKNISDINWEIIDLKLLMNNEIFQLAPPIKKVLFLTYQDKIKNQERILQLVDLATKQQIQWYALKYGLNISENYEWFSRLSVIEQVKNFDERKTDWNWMKIQAKVLYLYKLARENKVLPPYYIASERHQLIQILYKMMLSMTQKEKNTIFEEFNQWFHEIVIDRYGNDKRIDLWPILPYCAYIDKKVYYCEGNPWYRDRGNKINYNLEAKHIYCPKLKKVCNHKNIQNNGFSRVYPRLELPWEEWSIIEFMECYSIKATPLHIRDPRKYFTKIGGWTNRIGELFEKAKCRECGSTLKANLNYSKYSLAYSVTIFNCPNDGKKHDKDIYINHCWGCEKIIDSRESKIKLDDMYLCIHCGSGPRESKDYSPGQICPNCGEIDMKSIEVTNSCEPRKFICKNCNHSIEVAKGFK